MDIAYERNEMLYLTTHSTHFIHWLERSYHGATSRSLIIRERRNGRKEMFYLTTHSTHFIYGYMALDVVKEPWDNKNENPLSLRNKGRGMCYPVCGMVHIKEPLLLIGKSSLCGGSGFPLSLSEWSFTICPTPYNRN